MEWLRCNHVRSMLRCNKVKYIWFKCSMSTSCDSGMERRGNSRKYTRNQWNLTACRRIVISDGTPGTVDAQRSVVLLQCLDSGWKNILSLLTSVERRTLFPPSVMWLQRRAGWTKVLPSSQVSVDTNTHICLARPRHSPRAGIASLTFNGKQ